ncbi:MAG TPA: 4-amino-4-deoxy-L-arabinose transferase [Nocardioidaceae bacterium]|nr:4-amino-4-deoxy-L-arabinose transferase [Nocardioidaceae bacterium]
MVAAGEPVSTDETADLVLGLTMSRAPTLGSGRMVCVDGPAGSGKTTLAGAIEAAAARSGCACSLVHLDDLYPGWSGLTEGMARVRDRLVGPLSRGEPGGYHRYDWIAETDAEWHEVAATELLIVEGVGSGAADYHAAITTLVWVEVPADLRVARGLHRDGEQVRDHWLTWMADEDAMFARGQTRGRAHVLVDGTGQRPARIVAGW